MYVKVVYKIERKSWIDRKKFKFQHTLKLSLRETVIGDRNKNVQITPKLQDAITE